MPPHLFVVTEKWRSRSDHADDKDQLHSYSHDYGTYPRSSSIINNNNDNESIVSNYSNVESIESGSSFGRLKLIKSCFARGPLKLSPALVVSSSSCFAVTAHSSKIKKRKKRKDQHLRQLRAKLLSVFHTSANTSKILDEEDEESEEVKTRDEKVEGKRVVPKMFNSATSSLTSLTTILSLAPDTHENRQVNPKNIF